MLAIVHGCERRRKDTRSCRVFAIETGTGWSLQFHTAQCCCEILPTCEQPDLSEMSLCFSMLPKSEREAHLSCTWRDFHERQACVANVKLCRCYDTQLTQLNFFGFSAPGHFLLISSGLPWPSYGCDQSCEAQLWRPRQRIASNDRKESAGDTDQSMHADQSRSYGRKAD